MLQNLDFNNYFENRADAFSQLLEILPQNRMENEKWLIVGVNERAIALANMLSSKLNLSYDVLFSEEIVAPNNKECAVAMVSETEEIVMHEALIKSFDINLDYIYGQAHRLYDEKIIPKVYKYRKGELLNSLKDRNILFVDADCETGLRALSCIKTAIKAGALSVMYATPIMATDVFNSLQIITDEIFCVKKIENFVNSYFYYKDIQKLPEEDIIEAQ